MILTPKIQKAIIGASVLHADQKRKGDGLPYIIHPYSVAFILSTYTDDEDAIVAGLLHDTLEDVPEYEAEDLIKDFGERVYKIVQEVSEDKDPSDSKEKEKASWQERKEKYIANLKNDSGDALMVSCADKIHNLTSMINAYKNQGDELWKNFNAPKDKILWFYGEVLNVMEEKSESDIVGELRKLYFKARELFNE
jgi:(p)ppGpp synthase/HD superfamily hydrolase